MELKKNPDLDIGFKSSLYFALGLNLMLFITWQALEYKSYDKEEIAMEYVSVDEQLEDDIPITNLTAPPPPPPPPAAPEIISVVENIEDIEETVIESTETNQEEVIEERIVEVDEVDVDEVEEDIDVPFAVVESVPVFPGCVGANNDELKHCFQTKIQEHIKTNFRYPETALELRMQGKVFVIFTVGKDGRVSKIRTRGPDKILEKEAVRIFNLLPEMTPGKQRGKAVNVPFSIPVLFKLMDQ